jgi:hypothetical protein
MTPEERLPVAWGAFKVLAIKVLGRKGAAEYLRQGAAVLDAEDRVAERREAFLHPNVVNLENFR